LIIFWILVTQFNLIKGYQAIKLLKNFIIALILNDKLN